MNHYRNAKVETTGGAGNGEISLAISSEAPYERIFGIEILGHDPSEIDLSRLNDGRHPLLINHDRDQQVGVVSRVRIDKDRVLRGAARFSASPRAQEIRIDVNDNIRTLVSVGYFIEEMLEQKKNEDGELIERRLSWPEFEAEQKVLHGDQFYRAGVPAARGKGEEPPVYRVTRWTPFEASLVAVAADVTVGVGRSGEPEVRQAAAKPEPQPERIITMETKQKDPAELEAERRNQILDLGEQFKKYLGDKDVAAALRSGHSVEQFKDLVMQRMETRHSDTSALQIGMTRQDVKRYSLGRALQAAVLGDWTKAGYELECSRAVEKLIGQSPEGFYVPFDTFRRDFNVGTAAEAGNLVATDLRGDLYVDALRASMVMAGLGVRMLPGLTGNVDIPRKATPSTLAMLAEIGSATETAPATARLTLTPHRVGAYVEVSKQAIIQSAMALENMIRDDLLVGAAVLLENQAINGNGTAPNILGIRNTTSIGTVAAGTNGATVAWAHFVDLESTVANANSEPDRFSGYLTNTRVRGRAKQVQRGTNLPFIWDNAAQPLNGYRAAISNNVPNNLTKGTSTTVCSAAVFASDWSMAVFGLFGAPDVTVDPFTKADTGQVKITLNQFADFGIRQPGAFAVMLDMLTA